MQPTEQSGGNSTVMAWIGRVVSALPVLLLCFSASMKFMRSPEVFKGMDHLGYTRDVVMALGVLELTCALIYIIPWTSVVGAILLTGYMGGAIASHLRVGDPYWVQALVPILVWLGLFLREPRLRAILPWRG